MHDVVVFVLFYTFVIFLFERFIRKSDDELNEEASKKDDDRESTPEYEPLSAPPISSETSTSFNMLPKQQKYVTFEESIN